MSANAVGRLLKTSAHIALRDARAAPLAVQGVRKAVHFAEHHPEAEAVQQMFADLVPVMQSEDSKEGLRSFIERREAIFKGR